MRAFFIGLMFQLDRRANDVANRELVIRGEIRTSVPMDAGSPWQLLLAIEIDKNTAVHGRPSL